MATFASLASAHGRNWGSDARYRWAWYIWPQAASIVAAVWLLLGAPGAPKGEWSQPWQNTGVEIDALRDAAKTDPASLDRLKRLAEAGDPFAEFSYATLFDPAFNFTNAPNIDTAMEWYLKAAKQGNGSAQANYGARLYDGDYGVPVDYDKAFPWLLQGAQQGDVYAQRRVGESYKYGRGTKEDPKLAVQWFRTAADQGDAYSQAEMGDACADGNGVDQNMTDALAWYRKAADQKEDWAERQLGIIYLYGKNGVQRDPATAFQYLKDERRRRQHGRAVLSRLHVRSGHLRAEGRPRGAGPVSQERRSGLRRRPGRHGARLLERHRGPERLGHRARLV